MSPARADIPPNAKMTAPQGANRRILANAGSMMATTVLTALLGALFWWLAAREFTVQSVGVAAAAVSALTLLGYLATVGLGTLLMGELPRRAGGHRSLLNAALATSGLIGVALGLAFAMLSSQLSADLGALGGSWVAVWAFALGVGLTGLTAVLDLALIGLLRGGLQLSRNVVFSVAKLAGLALVSLLVANPDGVWIYSTWVAGIGVSLLALSRFYRKRGQDRRLRPDFVALSAMRRSAAGHHAFNLAIRAPDLVLPLIVVTVLGASANAHFYIAWMITTFALMIPVSLSTVLYAFGSGEAVGLIERYRLSIGLSAVLGVGAVGIAFFAGGAILGVFGASYAEGGLGALHVLVLGVFPETVKAHYLSICRLRRRIRPAMPIVAGGTALELAGAAVGGLVGGLVGVSAGWLCATAIEALVMAPAVLRFLSGTEAPPAPVARRSKRVGVASV